jgi:hypothetical protein
VTNKEVGDLWEHYGFLMAVLDSSKTLFLGPNIRFLEEVRSIYLPFYTKENYRLDFSYYKD